MPRPRFSLCFCLWVLQQIAYKSIHLLITFFFIHCSFYWSGYWSGYLGNFNFSQNDVRNMFEYSKMKSEKWFLLKNSKMIIADHMKIAYHSKAAYIFSICIWWTVKSPSDISSDEKKNKSTFWTERIEKMSALKKSGRKKIVKYRISPEKIIISVIQTIRTIWTFILFHFFCRITQSTDRAHHIRINSRHMKHTEALARLGERERERERH